MGELVSVLDDPNDHGSGLLDASNNSGKVFINGKKVVYKNSSSRPDDLCIPLGGDHCTPSSLGSSSKVFGEGIEFHRNNDSRTCGAVTIASGQSKVFCG
jgi:hypothetical protein